MVRRVGPSALDGRKRSGRRRETGDAKRVAVRVARSRQKCQIGNKVELTADHVLQMDRAVHSGRAISIRLVRTASILVRIVATAAPAAPAAAATTASTAMAGLGLLLIGMTIGRTSELARI